MKSLLAKTLITFLVLDFSQAWALTFKTSLRQIQLPSAVKRTARVRTLAPVPGVMSITGRMMCGDNDVQAYAGLFPTMDFVNGDTEAITYSEDGMHYTINITSTIQPVYTMVGYWLVRDGQDPLPTKDNFNNVAWGYMSVNPVGDERIQRMFPTTLAEDARVDIQQMLRKEVTKTQAISNKSFEHQADYKVYMGVFGCTKPVNENGDLERPTAPTSFSAAGYKPSNIDLSYSFVTQTANDLLENTLADAGWANTSAINSLVNRMDKVKIDLDPTNSVAVADGAGDAAPVKLKITDSSAGRTANLSSTALQKIRAVALMTYPTFPDYANAQAATRTATANLATAEAALRTAQRLVASSPAGTLFTAKRNAELFLSTGTSPDTNVNTTTAAQAAITAFNNKEIEIRDVLTEALNVAQRQELYARQIETLQGTNRNSTYQSHIRNQLNAILPAAMLTGDKLTQCAGMGLRTSNTDTLYRWENYPMNSSCRALYEGFLPIDSLYNSLATPSALIDEAEFTQRKKKLVQNIYMAAAIEAAQDYIQASNDLRMQNYSCFPAGAGTSYIDKLVASYPIKVDYDATTRKYLIDNSLVHQHPEPLFAEREGLWDYRTRAYVDLHHLTELGPNPPGNLIAVYCQVYGSACLPNADASRIPSWKNFGILIPVNGPNRADHLIDLNTFSPALTIDFKIRGLSREGRACEGEGFC